MRLIIISKFLLIPFVMLGQATVTNLVLNPLDVVAVYAATDRVTTISFPSPISHLEAAYVSTDAEPPSRFQLLFQGGNTFFSVRALGSNDRASVNVRWNANTYVFELIPSTRPMLALTMLEAIKPDLRRASQPPGAQRLLGMLDTAKAYALLRTQHPAEVSDIQYSSQKVSFDYGSYVITQEEVFRFQTEDTLVFRVVLTNKAKTPLNYIPQSFRLQVEQRVFVSAIADGNGMVPPNTSTPVYFAITVAPDGTRPALAIQNNFIVLLTLAAPPPAGQISAQPISIIRQLPTVPLPGPK